VPKVNRACSTVPSTVDATVISALATTHGMSVAVGGTAALEARPTPPPRRTNRTKVLTR
jgi:hypothetical protein